MPTDHTPRLEDLTRQQLKALAAELTERLQTEEFLQGETATTNRIYSAELRAEQQSHAETKRELAVAVEALGEISEGREPQCLVARLGEMTAECNISAPCVACRAGAARRSVRTELESSRAALQEEQASHMATVRLRNKYEAELEGRLQEERERREAAERVAEAYARARIDWTSDQLDLHRAADEALSDALEAYEAAKAKRPRESVTVEAAPEVPSSTPGTSVDRWPPRTIPDQQLVEIEGSGT